MKGDFKRDDGVEPASSGSRLKLGMTMKSLSTGNIVCIEKFVVRAIVLVLITDDMGGHCFDGGKSSGYLRRPRHDVTVLNKRIK